MKQAYITIQAAAAALIAWLSARLGILLPVLGILAVAMVLDYITGMLASKREAIEHPGDSSYGWSSKRGAEGIIKKVGYLCIIAAALIVDYIILHVAAQIGLQITLKAFFGLLVAVWYILNELLGCPALLPWNKASFPSFCKVRLSERGAAEYYPSG